MEEKKKVKSKGLKLALIVLIILGLFFLREDRLYNVMSKFKNLSVKEMSLEHVNRVNLKGAGKIDLYNERILNWNEKSLSVLSLDGSPIIKKDFQFENPDIVFGKAKIYIMDKNLGNVYILNENGETEEKIQSKKGIFNLKEEGEKLIIHTKKGDGEAITFMDSKGEEIASTSKARDILTYSMDDKASKYLISNIDMLEGMESQVNIYNLDGNLENTLNFPGELVLYTEFIGKEQLVLTNLKLYLIGDGQIIFEKQYAFIKDIKIIDREIYILYDSNLEVLNFKGEVQDKYVFSKIYNKIFVHRGLGILYGDHNVLGVKKGKIVLDYEMEEEIKAIYGNGNIMGIGLNDRIDLYYLKDKK